MTKMIDKNSTREEVLDAISQNGLLLEFASEKFKDDPDLVLAAVMQCAFALEYASSRLKNNELLVLSALAGCGSALQFASDNLRNKREVALAAIMQESSLLYYASDKLKNDRELVLIAVIKSGSSLQYAAPKLQNDLFLLRVSLLKDASALSILLPLKKKLNEEKDPEKKEAAQMMITAMEEAIVSKLEIQEGCKQKPNYSFKASIDFAVICAIPTLEKQSIWKSIIDDVVNELYKLLPETLKKQDSHQKRFTLFGNPNLFEEEIKQAKIEMENKLGR